MMYPIQFSHVETLVRAIAIQVVSRFYAQLQWATDDHSDYSEATDTLAEDITKAISLNWNDLTTAHQAENKVEEIYNAARTELVRLLNLQGGTVEFGPGDVQPLTDQRLGQSEAWDLWLDHMQENEWRTGDDYRS